MSKYFFLMIPLVVALAGIACGDDDSDGGGGTGGVAAGGTGGDIGKGGTGGDPGKGGTGGGPEAPCTATGLTSPDCQACIMDAANRCPLAVASCLLGGSASTCIQEHECVDTTQLPPEVDASCVLENCTLEVMEANACLMDKCPAYVACFPG
ncbi:MAG TPA: hypothetical protein VGD74_10850 [Vulgatibacter sp.]